MPYAAAAESVIDVIFLFTSLCDVKGAVRRPEAILRAAQRDPPAAEISFHVSLRGRLQHFSMPRAGPFTMNFSVTSGAGSRAYVKRRGLSTPRCRRQDTEARESRDRKKRPRPH